MLCTSCAREPEWIGGLCEFCMLLYPPRPPSAMTVQEYFEQGVAEGFELYRTRGPSIMRSLRTIGAKPDTSAGRILEQVDIDALTRGVRAGLVRANRAAHGLPQVCVIEGCGFGYVCDTCKEFRKNGH